MRFFKLAFVIGACTATLVGQQPQPSRPADVPTLPDRGPLTIEPAAAAEILAGVKAPPGFRVSVFAAPPIVNYPTCVTATLTGELYVCVDRNSSLQTDPEMGSILRLVDRDKDGRADEYTVFARMDSPRGAVFDGDTLYVTHPPFVSALRDTNGDGISDETRTLVRGLGFGLDFRGADHTTNGLEFGPDGWLYVAVGDYGFVKAVGADGRELQLRGGGNVRVRPDGTELEIYSVGTRNDYDVAIDPFLNLFARGNTNDGGGWDIRLNHFVAGGNFGYPSLFRNFGDEVLQPLADYGGGSGAGMLFVQDPGLPAEYGNTLYSVDWGTNTIYRHPLTAKGATFTAGQEIFTTLPRPTDLAIDGASRLYAASWRGGQYRYGGEQIGFIAQLTATAGKASEPPDLKAATDARLVEVLVSRNQVHRRFAQHEMLRRGRSPERVSLIERQLAGRAELAGRVAAIYTLKQLAGQDATAALLAAAGDPALRRHALRALADRRTELAGVSAETFVRALKDPDPTVQLQAITGLERLGAVTAAGAILPLTTSADAVVSHVAIDALVSLAAIQPSLAVVATGSPAQAKAALRVLQRLHTVPTVSGLIELLPRIKDGETRGHALQALARLYHRDGVWRGTLPEWWGTRPDPTGPYYDPVAWDQSPRILPVLRQAILQAPTTAPAETTRLLSDLTRNRVMPPGATEVIAALHAARDAALPTVVDALLGRMRLEIDAGNAGLFEELSARPAYRAAVVRMVAAGSPPSPRAAGILHRAAVDATTEPEARAAALVALMSATDPRARDRAIDAFVTIDPAPGLHPALDRAWRQFVGSPTHAQNVAAFRSLAGAPEPARQVLGYAVLLQLAAEPAAGGRGARGGGRGGRGQGVAAAEAARAEARTAVEAAWSGASVAALLRAIGLTQASGYTARIQALIQTAATPADVRAAAEFAASRSRDTTMAAGATLVSAVAYEELAARVGALKGDPELGRTMFTRQGCSACHTASPEETEKGPFLGGIGTRYSVAEIVESIVRPNARVAQGFATTWFDTKDGKQVQGFVVREGNLDVVIRDLAGVETTLMKTQITARGVREGSVMPTGLVDTLTLQELASLLAYMSAPGAK